MIAPSPDPLAFPTAARRQAVRDYIRRTWDDLTRSPAHIADAARDPKLDRDGGPWPVYVSANEDFDAVARSLAERIPAADRRDLDLRVLPAEVEAIAEHGLLYLPHDYAVPGGRFNEMYGWDSYFIVLGLLRDDRRALARSMADQLVYEVEHYGTVLNANRTYLLTRSQPPFLTQTIRKVFEAEGDRDWLRSVLPAAERYYYYWTVPPHLNASTGLSRYYDLGHGPAPEVVSSERDAAGRTHYDRVRDYYRTHAIADYDASLYYDRDGDRLTDLFYKGDRSMRESGLDPTNRFGPFSVDVIHYAPVCLNALLYQMEGDLADLNAALGHRDGANYWHDRARERQQAVDRHLWDEEAGLYFDYNFATGRRRTYPYLSAFYPLWTGLASEAQARRVAENLSQFEQPGGLRASTAVTGNQWDAPFGWAPLQLIAVEGLYRYGYGVEGDRLARKFVALLVRDFERCGTLLEKYDVCACTGDVSADIQFGYSSNEVGFGWTNGAFLELLGHLERRSGDRPEP